MNRIRFGIDLGNVIIDHAGFGTTSQYVQFGDYAKIPPVKDSLESLKQLLRQDHIEMLAIIYNATEVADQKILDWFACWLPQEVSLSPKFTFFRSSAGRYKLLDCRRFGITHFVDDRVEVLNGLKGEVAHLFLLNANPEEKKQHTDRGDFFREVSGWAELTTLLLTTKL